MRRGRALPREPMMIYCPPPPPPGSVFSSFAALSSFIRHFSISCCTPSWCFSSTLQRVSLPLESSYVYSLPPHPHLLLSKGLPSSIYDLGLPHRRWRLRSLTPSSRGYSIMLTNGGTDFSLSRPAASYLSAVFLGDLAACLSFSLYLSLSVESVSGVRISITMPMKGSTHLQ